MVHQYRREARILALLFMIEFLKDPANIAWLKKDDPDFALYLRHIQL